MQQMDAVLVPNHGLQRSIGKSECSKQSHVFFRPSHRQDETSQKLQVDADGDGGRSLLGPSQSHVRDTRSVSGQVRHIAAAKTGEAQPLAQITVPAALNDRDAARYALTVLAYSLFDGVARASVAGQPWSRPAAPKGRPKLGRARSNAERQHAYRQRRAGVAPGTRSSAAQAAQAPRPRTSP